MDSYFDDWDNQKPLAPLNTQNVRQQQITISSDDESEDENVARKRKRARKSSKAEASYKAPKATALPKPIVCLSLTDDEDEAEEVDLLLPPLGSNRGTAASTSGAGVDVLPPLSRVTSNSVPVVPLVTAASAATQLALAKAEQQRLEFLQAMSISPLAASAEDDDVEELPQVMQEPCRTAGRSSQPATLSDSHPHATATGARLHDSLQASTSAAIAQSRHVTDATGQQAAITVTKLQLKCQTRVKGQEVTIALAPDAPFSKLMAMFEEHAKAKGWLAANSDCRLTFQFDDGRLRDSDTPASKEMVDDDVIDVKW